MRSIFRLTGLAIVLLATNVDGFDKSDQNDGSGQKAVLVTGASTGLLGPVQHE